MSRFYSVLLALSLFLGACASGEAYPPAYDDGPLTPLPGEYSQIKDPDNGKFFAAMDDYLRVKGAPRQTSYEYTRIDLNGDGRREALILMNRPHHYWCGLNGCSMAVFEAHNEGFSLRSEIAPVRGPLVVSETSTNGWRDLIARVSGRLHAEAKDVALRYDGLSYPPQPAMQPALYASYAPRGVEIFPR